MKLNKKDKEFFFENGYLIIKSLFSKKECDKIYKSALNFANKDFAPLLNIHRNDFVMAQCADKISKIKSTIEKVKYIQHLQDSALIAKKYFIHPRLKTIFEFIYGKKISGLQTQIIYKKPGTRYAKVAHNPHQDNSYGMNPNGLFFVTHIFLNKTDYSNGTIYIYPKSHKEGLLSFESFKSYQNKKVKHANKVDTQKYKKNKLDIILNKGDFLITHGNLIHGSYSNKSKIKPRPIFCSCYIVKGEKFRKGYTADRKVLNFK